MAEALSRFNLGTENGLGCLGREDSLFGYWGLRAGLSYF